MVDIEYTCENGNSIRTKVFQRNDSHGIKTWAHMVYLNGKLCGFNWNHRSENEARKAASIAGSHLESMIG